MSFGAAFDAFVGGMSKGLQQGGKMQDDAERRRPAKEARELTKEASAAAFGTDRGNSMFDKLRSRLQSNVGPTPTQGAIPEGSGAMEPKMATADDQLAYAQGGYVDPVEDDNGAYYRREAARVAAQPRAAIPEAPVSTPLSPTASDGTPTPAPRPAEMGGSAPAAAAPEGGGNMIQKTISWLKDQRAPDQGAVPTPQDGAAPGAQHPIVGMVDPTGKSYPDLTQTIGGIRQVTGAPADKPLTTTDHLNFLQKRFDLAVSKGYDLNEAMKFNVQYLDNLRLQAGRSFALASAAWDAGDGAAVQKFVQNGYGLVPDGREVKTSFKGGVLTVQPTDDKGKPLGDPVTMTKDQFLQRSRDVTGNLISYGRAIADEPLPAGYSGGSRRRRRGGGRYSDTSTDTGAGTGGGAAVKPMTASFGTALDKSLKGISEDGKVNPAYRRRAEALYKAGANDEGPATVAAWAQQYDSGDLKLKETEKGFGLYNSEGTMIKKLNKAAFPALVPKNAGGDQATPPPATTPVSTAAKPAAAGNPDLKRAPGAKGAIPDQAPAGTAVAAPMPSPRSVTAPASTDPKGPGGRPLNEEIGSMIKRGARKVFLGNEGNPGGPAIPEASEPAPAASGEAAARLAIIEKRIADAEKSGATGFGIDAMKRQAATLRAQIK